MAMHLPSCCFYYIEIRGLSCCQKFEKEFLLSKFVMLIRVSPDALHSPNILDSLECSVVKHVHSESKTGAAAEGNVIQEMIHSQSDNLRTLS